ncbi:MAG: cytochrome c biogenesis protein [Methanotrichaceae archaeon]|nr:cytochrome c biogenesis protein [Methanotrichaceae archaeon]
MQAFQYCITGLLLVLALIMVLLPAPASCNSQITIITSPGCSKCAAADRVLTSVLADYKNISTYEIIFSSEEGHKIIKEHKAKDVPSIIIGNSVIGYRDYEGNETELKLLIKTALEGPNVSILKMDETDGNFLGTERTFEDLNISSAAYVLAAGLLAGFNPCLLAILAFLASTVLASAGHRRDILTMVVFFTMGIFVVYYIFGVGLFSVLQDKSTASVFRLVLACILLVLGLMQLEDARRLQSGGESLFRTDWTTKYVHGALASRRLGSYFLLGALFSLVKAPCVGAVYIAIISIISSQGYASSGLFYLMMYNLGIVLPVLLLGGFIALGMSPEQVDRFRHKHRVAIRAITGSTLIILAPLIYWQLI